MMKKLLLLTSAVFFVLFSLELKAQVTIDSVVVSNPISCFGDLADIDVYVDTKSKALDESLDKCSKIIATTAHRYGVDRKRHGPFSKNASLFGYDYSGGKTDDVTVVLGYVV